MAVHKVFSDFGKAAEYILSKEGIYGGKQRACNYSGVSVVGKPYNSPTFNGYEIKFMTLD